MIHLPANAQVQQDSYYCHISVFTPENPYPLHDHKFFEFFIVVKGRLKHVFNGDAVIYEPGTICLLHPEDAHELHCAPGSSSAEILNFNVTTDEVRRLFHHIAGDSHIALEDCVQQVFPEHSPLRHALMEEAEDIYYSENGFWKKARLKLLLENILLLLIRTSGFSADSAPEWLRNARTAMRRPENYRAGLKRFIELSGRTQEHLCRAMRRYYSETPQQWLTSIRLEAVFDRLLRRGGDVSIAAFEAGFHNLAWFRRAFRKRYAVSPKAIRKRD